MVRFAKLAIVLVAVGLALTGCSSDKKTAKLDPFAGKGSPHYTGKGPVPWGGGRRHVGKPYQVAGRWFTPKEQPNYDKKGTASWYGEAFHKRKTSNGEWFDMNRLTAAHATLPLPSYVKVTNLANGKDVIVRVNDRGPFVDTRVIDLSKKTAEVLDFKNKGKAQVRVQFIGPAPLNDNGSHLMAMNKELDRGTPLRTMIAAADRHKGKSAPSNVMIAEAAPAKVKKAPVAKAETVAYVPPAAEQSPAFSEQPAGAVETSYYVQLGSFGDQANAERARDQFSNVWPVQFIELMGTGGPVFRVRLGPIADATDADTALENAYAAGYADARMIKSQAVQASLE
ncbi:septal ring lytic transglycosylase RlpA family protein [Aestuariivirga sp.]|uniref:septal ring lytic transglycosylase RlpA family protein n=1 Tax=Aestuariivirga sp. TaxID=2650926 RepID=UPI003593CD6D